MACFIAYSSGSWMQHTAVATVCCLTERLCRCLYIGLPLSAAHGGSKK